MPFSNIVRLVNFHVYTNNITKEGLTRACDFLLKYKHPDIPLNLHIHYSKSSSVSLKYLTRIFLSLPQTFLHIESDNYSDMLSFEKDLLLKHFSEIRFLKKENYRDFDEEMIYFRSRFKDVWVVYEVDENHTDVFNFKEFYDALGIKNTYRIDYFYKYENKKSFIKNLVEELNKIRSTDINYLYVYNQQLPYLLGTLNGDIITHKKNTSIDMWDNKSLDAIILKASNIDRCYNCPAINICKGGDYTVFEQTDNADVFCAINIATTNLKYNKEK